MNWYLRLFMKKSSNKGLKHSFSLPMLHAFAATSLVSSLLLDKPTARRIWFFYVYKESDALLTIL